MNRTETNKPNELADKLSHIVNSLQLKFHSSAISLNIRAFNQQSGIASVFPNGESVFIAFHLSNELELIRFSSKFQLVTLCGRWKDELPD